MILSLKKGFTLIELLVVIAIIGILISAATANFIIAQRQARDARRMQDMEAVQTSFETYFAINASYPSTDPEIDSAFEGGTRPEDPQDPAEAYTFLSDADSYCICADLETQEGNASGGTADGCTWDTSGTKFCIQNKQ